MHETNVDHYCVTLLNYELRQKPTCMNTICFPADGVCGYLYFFVEFWPIGPVLDTLIVIMPSLPFYLLTSSGHTQLHGYHQAPLSYA